MKKVYSDWNDHEAPRLGAALAFYTVLSLAPLLLLLLAIVGMFFDQSQALQQIMSQVQALLGKNGADAIRLTLESAQKSNSGSSASIVSVVVLLVGASGVFGELRSALNKVWDVKPQSTAGIWGMIREKFLSFGMVIAVGFLLLASLVLSAMLAAVSTFFGGLLPMPTVITGLIDVIVSILGVTVLFALMFRYVPAAKVAWRPIWVGALFTAVLFTLGKYLIGIYLAKAGVGSAYGAAGSVIVIIVWVYYTAQIVFLGAEFTHVLSQPAPHEQSEQKMHQEPAKPPLPA